jgi:hypothetical protein
VCSAKTSESPIFTGGCGKHFPASSACARRGWWPGTSTGCTPPGIPPLCQLMGCGSGVDLCHAGAGGLNPPVMGPASTKPPIAQPRFLRRALAHRPTCATRTAWLRTASPIRVFGADLADLADLLRLPAAASCL